jgi:glycosyltransferase involved in cell wall biosynthesis
VHAAVIIPALDEEEAIARVIAAIPADVVDNIIVVDNGSTDATADVARSAGARVVREPDTDLSGSDGQGNADEMDILSLGEVVVFPPSGAPPDKTRFKRGDANDDDLVNITDGIFVLNFLFLGGPTPTCMEAAVANDDGQVNITVLIEITEVRCGTNG